MTTPIFSFRADPAFVEKYKEFEEMSGIKRKHFVQDAVQRAMDAYMQREQALAALVQRSSRALKKKNAKTLSLQAAADVLGITKKLDRQGASAVHGNDSE